MRNLAALLSCCLVVAIGCTGSQPTNLTVFGAASLKSALDQVKAQFRVNSGPPTSLAVSTGSSTMLRMQIEQGAAADLFLSADASNPQALVDEGMADGAAEPFASNMLTIAVPDGNPASITSAADLAKDGIRVVAAGADVPITKYTEQAVGKLAALPGYPTDFAAAYAANIVSREDNVGAVTSKIDLGEGDAAIVYVTDAKNAGLETVDIPLEANVVASYNGVVLNGSTNKAAAHALLDWIQGPAGQKILTDVGFSPAQ
jgi:molybdate transport system substrate-binding protein